MEQQPLLNEEEYARNNARRRRWRKIVQVMACIVVFCTTYALILPAITMERDNVCGLEEHAHSDACYSQLTSQEKVSLECTYTSLGVHEHTAECTNTDGELTCGLSDFIVHAHDASCYDTAGSFVCHLPEVKEHEHTEECYAPVETDASAHIHEESCYTLQLGELVCSLEESEGHIHTEECGEAILICEATVDPHVHGNDCYEQLVCALEESEGHTHTEGCSETVLICEATVDPHVHGNDCYEQLVCDLPEDETHAHSDACSGKVLICELTEQPHIHVDSCWQTNSLCSLPESEGHTHSDACSGQILRCDLTEQPHIHADNCWKIDPICELPESDGHIHENACYEQIRELTCEIEERSAEEPPAITEDAEPELICEKEEIRLHSHNDACYEISLDTEGNEIRTLICSKPEVLEHVHKDSCFTVEDVPVDTESLTCTQEAAHVHAEACYDEAETLVCTEPTEGHVHGAMCYGTWVQTCQLEVHAHNEACYPEHAVTYYCGLEEHSHSKECSDEEGNQICTMPEHAHAEECKSSSEDNYFCGDDEHEHTILCTANLSGLSDEDREKVERVILLIDEMPSADEIDAKIVEFEEAEDYEGEEAWLTEVYQQVGDVYLAYSELTTRLQQYVGNVDKLTELEYIWAAQVLIEDITSAAPTLADWTSTKDFIELNLYDYNYQINANWESDKKYPGFQWNGGAYAKSNYKYSNSTADDGIPNYVTDRNYIDSIDFGNSIITNFAYAGTDYAKSTTSVSVGKLYNNSNASSTGKINWLWYDGSSSATTTNRPVGMSTGYQSLSNTLVNGYPALADGTSLKYLFTAGTAVTKQNTESIDGLFLQNDVTGEYSYNSRENHAQYSNNRFVRYNQIITPNFITYPFGNFLPLNTITDLTQATQVGAFNYDGGVKAYVEGTISDLTEEINRDDDGNGTTADYGDTSRYQLITMLQEYRENWNLYPTSTGVTWNNLSAANAIRDYFSGDSNGNGDAPSSNQGFITQAHLDNMYNIDWNVATNFFFGMEMKMHFMQPKGGITGNDTDGDGDSDFPMQFYFTGDDDVWVYIDGVLFLDLSGIHRHVGGEIDFVNGKVNYYELSPATGDVSTTAYKTYTFAELLEAAGKSTDGLNSNGTFEDYSTHDFNFYYMERGSGSSVCRLNFNFPLLKKNSISVNKENFVVDANDAAVNGTVNGDPDYYFNIMSDTGGLFVGPNSKTGITTYKVMDSAGNILKNTDGTDKIFTVDQYGIFTLKAGQTAVFEGIEENEGEYYVQELIKAEDNAQYPIVHINGEETRYNQIISWSSRTYFTEAVDSGYDASNPTIGPYGFEWYGRSGQDTDSSTNSAFYFKQQNHVDVSKLGSLVLTKQVQRYVAPLAETYYRMYITLDGKPLNEGMTVTVTGADGTTTRTATVGREVVDGETVSYIDIAEGETALIPNIISGTQFKIWESAESASGYNVAYSVTDADEIVNGAGYISGVVRVDTQVVVTITNAERGTQIEIPAVKCFRNFVEGAYTYTFTLTETNEAGIALENGTIASETVEVTANGTTFTFNPITYLAQDYENFPAVHYYRVEECDEANTQVFQVEVTISEDSSTGSITAAVTKVSELTDAGWTEVTNQTVTFVNTLTADLSLQKLVDGSEATKTNGTFDFKVTLTDVNGDPVAGPFAVTAYNNDGTSASWNASFDNGTHTFEEFHHSEKLVIHGVPLGTNWTVQEVSAGGYIVSWTVNGEEAANENNSVSGRLLDSAVAVVCTNTSTYMLPETGGTGTYQYTAVGLLLMMAAAVLLYIHNHKRRKEERPSF